MNNAHDAYYSQPVINGEKYDLLKFTMGLILSDEKYKDYVMIGSAEKDDNKKEENKEENGGEDK